MGKMDVAIAGFIRARIMELFHSKAALAKMRRGVGKELGDVPELLGFVLPSEEISSYKEDEILAEKAIYTALTLYALHQQGNGQCMSAGVGDKDGTLKYKNSFGHAVRTLINDSKDKDVAITRRFDKVLTAKDVTEIAVHARGLIGLLKKADIPLHYPDFAADLYWFQQSDYRRSILLKWGKDYYMNTGKED